ncbi:hypothetical protein D3C86_2231090 [compost metagenome]
MATASLKVSLMLLAMVSVTWSKVEADRACASSAKGLNEVKADTAAARPRPSTARRMNL